MKASHQLEQKHDGELYIPKGKIITFKQVLYMKYQRLQKKCKIHESNSPDSIVLAKAYNELGEYFLKNGFIEAALEEFLKSLVILTIQEPESVLHATVLYNVSKVYVYQKLYTHALKQLSKSLEIRLKLNPKCVAVLELYSGLEYVSDKLGQPEKVQEYKQLTSELENSLYEDATLDITKGIKTSAESLCRYYKESGQHIIQEYHDTKEQAGKSESAELSNLLFDATLSFEAGLSLIKKVKSLHALQASLYVDLGKGYNLQGNYSEAVSNYHAALELYESISEHKIEGNAEDESFDSEHEHTFLMVKIAELHKHIGDAVLCLKETEIQSSSATKACTTVFNIETTVNPIKLAQSSIDDHVAKSSETDVKGQPSSPLTVALQHYKQAEQIIDLFNPSSLLAASLYSAISSVHDQLKKYPLSLEYMQKVITILEKEQPKSLILAEAHSSLGQTFFDSGDTKAALLHFQIASELFELLVPDSPLVASSYVQIGLVYRDQGYPSTALVEYQKALAIYTALNPNCDEVSRVQKHIEALAKRPHVKVSYL